MLKELQTNGIKKLSIDALNVLCDEMRRAIKDTVSETGGHLSSNLGVVETTVAMHYVFDFPKDKIVFDVGHQCYPHKLLSGRLDKFHTLRQYGGLSGFPKREESEYDSFNTGHAGTAISAAMGIAKARDIKGEKFNVMALIGDGSFNNGLIYEALNSISILKSNFLIILNDNGMSISPTVGGMHDILGNLGKEEERNCLNVALLERFGLKYVGVKNGNDVEEMVNAFNEVKPMLENSPVLLHVVTKKGRGYDFCEDNPTATHGVSPKASEKQREYSKALGNKLIELAKQDDRITAVTAAMTGVLGLGEFFERFPERSFDVGICEEHATVLVAAMATQGLKPYYAIYSTFLQRSYDEIIHDICAQNLPVTMCIDRAGISGADGETHQGVFDLSYLLAVPNLTVAVPKDIEEFENILEFSVSFNAPLAIRYPRGGNGSYGEHGKISGTSWEYLENNGGNFTLLAAGERCVNIAYAVLNALKKENINVNIVNARFVKPLDKALLNGIAAENIITLEDNMLGGGFGSYVCEYFSGSGKRVKSFAYRDEFIVQGEVPFLMEKYGLSVSGILDYIKGIK